MWICILERIITTSNPKRHISILIEIVYDFVIKKHEISVQAKQGLKLNKTINNQI